MPGEARSPGLLSPSQAHFQLTVEEVGPQGIDSQHPELHSCQDFINQEVVQRMSYVVGAEVGVSCC